MQCFNYIGMPEESLVLSWKNKKNGLSTFLTDWYVTLNEGSVEKALKPYGQGLGK